MAKQVLIDTNSFDDYVKDVLSEQRQALCETDLDIAIIIAIGLYSAGAMGHLRELIYGKEEN